MSSRTAGDHARRAPFCFDAKTVTHADELKRPVPCNAGLRRGGTFRRAAGFSIRQRNAMARKLVQFFAIICTALALVPAGAHVFALPNKIHLAQEPYFIVQNVYRGWALFGIVLFAALAIDLALAVMLRHQPGPFWLALLGFFCVAATLVIFFLVVYPANLATENWTAAPAYWADLRDSWEYGHAVNAVITFVALCLVTGAVVWARD